MPVIGPVIALVSLDAQAAWWGYEVIFYLRPQNKPKPLLAVLQQKESGKIRSLAGKKLTLLSKIYFVDCFICFFEGNLSKPALLFFFLVSGVNLCADFRSGTNQGECRGRGDRTPEESGAGKVALWWVEGLGFVTSRHCTRSWRRCSPRIHLYGKNCST